MNYGWEFDPSCCAKCGGKCCTGESGFIWITPQNAKDIATFLGIGFDEFVGRYLKKVGFKFSLKEKPYNGGFACVFFDEKMKNCQIYDFRPSQCEKFPFWSYFIGKEDELAAECIGVKFS